ncbi:MAG: hypothetical protein LBS55_02030 [Prevotellaceae bacterium]|jgi:gas vesicle protein|nr:hypothetical protein [Prevotellaceae bacterium]
MGTEQITLIGVAVTVIVAVAGGLWGMVQFLREFGKEFRSEMQSVRTELKDEIQTIRTELKDEIQTVRTELKDEIQAVKTELKDEIQAVKTELKDEIQAVRTEMRDEFRTVRTELKTEIGRLENRVTHIDQKLDFIGYGYDFTQNPPKKLRTRRLVRTDE